MDGGADSYSAIYDFGNLYSAFKRSYRGKRGQPSADRYAAAALDATRRLSDLLRDKRYRVGQYREFKVFEPKERVVQSNNFVDKVVQHSLCDNILEPALTGSFIYDNYASQHGKGTHAGLDRLARFMREHYRKHGADGYILKGDVSKYFYNISHEPLREMLYRKIHDPDTRWLIDQIIDSTPDPGLPIGNQTSQFFALLYLDGLDHHIKDRRGVKHYGRYMDDFYIIHESKDFLREMLAEIKHFVAALGLTLNNKTQIFPLRQGMDFLGFHSYLTDSGKVIRKVRAKSKNNARRKLKKLRDLYVAGKIDRETIKQSYWSWRGHAQHGNTYRLIRETDKQFIKAYYLTQREENQDGKSNIGPEHRR
jgi:retron-type reverse transcriptase